MSNVRTCPYYIVNNEAEFAAACKELGRTPSEILYAFPMIVGADGITFQCPAKDHPLADYFDADRNRLYKYELRELPRVSDRTESPEAGNPAEDLEGERGAPSSEQTPKETGPNVNMN